MGVRVRIISKGGEETEEKAVTEQKNPVFIEETVEPHSHNESEKYSSHAFSCDKSYRAKTAYTRFGYGAVVVTGAVISAVMLLALWLIKGFGGEEAALIAERIICLIG